MRRSRPAVGGSRGSNFSERAGAHLLTRVAARRAPRGRADLVGEGDVDRTRARYTAAVVRAEVLSHLDDMGHAYAEADVAIVSAGAGVLAELAAAGVPALVVPLAHATGDHQAANARAFAAATGAPWTREETWDADERADWLVSLLASPTAWVAASAGVRRLVAVDAAGAVVRACEAVVTARASGGSRAP